MQELVLLLVFSGVVLLSAATQALTGFGFALVALSILGLGMDVREAVLAIAPAGLALNVILFLQLRKGFSWDGLAPLIVACVISVPAGTWFLLNVHERGLKLTMAAVMIGTALHRVWLNRQSQVQVWHPIRAGVPCGLLSGVLAGAFGAGGPPVVSYLMNRPVNRFQYVASMQVVAGICSTLRLAQFVATGRYETGHLQVILPSIPAVALGVLVGTKILRKASDNGVRTAVIGFLFVGGLYYLWCA